MKKDFYSIKEAADYLEVDYKVVYRLVREGKIPSSRVGWQYRMSQEDLNAYLNAQRTKQGNNPGSAVSPRTASKIDKTANGNGHGGNGSHFVPDSVTRAQARQMEIHVIHSFRQKVENVAAIQHPITRQTLYIENWETLYHQNDNHETLMHLLQTAFLDRETLATIPHNCRVRYTVDGSFPLILELRFVSHLQHFCETGKDETPATPADLQGIIQEVEEEQRQTRAAYIIGLASPTGWSPEAVDMIRNPIQGLSVSHLQIHIFLLDPRTGKTIHNEQDPEANKFAGLFRLPILAEDQKSLADELRAELAKHSGIILEDFAVERGTGQDTVLQAARLVEEEGHSRLLKDPAVGWMLVNV